MKYCYNCNHITPGEPLFCNCCGKSYDTKLCPRLHPNPRSAQACSRCGSRDLSSPQPKVPWWARPLEFVLRCIPGALLVAATVSAILAVLQALIQNPKMLVALFFLLAALGILWWMWGQVPKWFREAVYRLLKRHRDGDDRRRD